MQSKSASQKRDAGLLKIVEVAEILNLSPRSIWRLIGQGHLRIIRAGRAVRVPAKGAGSVEEFIRKGGSR